MERKRLGDLLVESGMITAEQLQKALQEQQVSRQKLGDVLLSQGYISETQLIEVLEFQLGIPHVSLFKFKFDQSLTGIINESMAKRYQVIPLKKEGSKLMVAMADPLDYFALDDLRMSTGFQIEQAIATRDDIQRAIMRYYSLQESVNELMEDLPQDPTQMENELADEDSPIVRLVNQLIQQAVQTRASDIHFDPQEDSLRVRLRIDGLLRTERTLPRHMTNIVTARLKIMANLNIAERRIPQDGRLKMEINMKEIDIRVSTLPTLYGEKVVMRLLDLSTAISDVERLGFNKRNIGLFLKMLDVPSGLILITGPTGTGKSSTLYAALNRLNGEDVNIITVEDPVEYQLEGVNQVQVNPAAGMTFAKGLRAILRQDPNIVMVGEVRDLETAEIAIRASLTGHLVLSTLHTNDAVSTITRLVDMGIPPFLLSSSLTGVVSQRLVRRICSDCRTEVEPTAHERALLERRGLQWQKLYKGQGCGNCSMTGYRGRLAIHEVLVVDDALRRMILENRPAREYRQHAVKNGMILLLDDGLLKVLQGHTTIDEVLRVAVNE
ncbi:type II secretion system protein GspE [Brevibacillus fluminis]|uniref:Type II secretion system protein GspE n=1 Tax=Brevibacillus fluminis TaxID=511487 RepID=A0A3M8DT61_9BACL|nr:ATPase, T2SS/T4P/T4SS family [Brevibacillus fluminis]RNB90561.1 type II secretion system protein GspE [Brevibacillus fluminis]